MSDLFYSKSDNSLKDITQALREDMEHLEAEPFAPFLVSDKAYALIKKLNIKTCIGNPIQLYDQLGFTFVWYKTAVIDSLGLITYTYHMNSMIFKENEVNQVADVLWFMTENRESVDRNIVNAATISIYDKGKHIADCIHDDYCEFLADVNNPHAMYHFNRMSYGNGDGGEEGS
jgi:hypothetical protein